MLSHCWCDSYANMHVIAFDVAEVNVNFDWSPSNCSVLRYLVAWFSKCCRFRNDFQPPFLFLDCRNAISSPKHWLYACGEFPRYPCTLCLKNVPRLACYNFDTRERILILFDRNFTEKVSNGKTLYYATSNHLYFCATWQNGQTQKLHFHSNTEH